MLLKKQSKSRAARLMNMTQKRRDVNHVTYLINEERVCLYNQDKRSDSDGNDHVVMS